MPSARKVLISVVLAKLCKIGLCGAMLWKSGARLCSGRYWKRIVRMCLGIGQE